MACLAVTTTPSATIRLARKIGAKEEVDGRVARVDSHPRGVVHPQSHVVRPRRVCGDRARLGAGHDDDAPPKSSPRPTPNSTIRIRRTQSCRCRAFDRHPRRGLVMDAAAGFEAPNVSPPSCLSSRTTHLRRRRRARGDVRRQLRAATMIWIQEIVRVLAAARRPGGRERGSRNRAACPGRTARAASRRRPREARRSPPG